MNPPPEIPPDMAAPDFDEDDVEYAPSWLLASRIFLAVIGLVFLILLAWRGLKCGV